MMGEASKKMPKIFSAGNLHVVVEKSTIVPKITVHQSISIQNTLFCSLVDSARVVCWPIQESALLRSSSQVPDISASLTDKNSRFPFKKYLMPFT
jgi:hypothetical protein